MSVRETPPGFRSLNPLSNTVPPALGAPPLPSPSPRRPGGRRPGRWEGRARRPGPSFVPEDIPVLRPSRPGGLRCGVRFCFGKPTPSKRPRNLAPATSSWLVFGGSFDLREPPCPRRYSGAGAPTRGSPWGEMRKHEDKTGGPRGRQTLGLTGSPPTRSPHFSVEVAPPSSCSTGTVCHPPGGFETSLA
ncbi:unnamed protein product [Nyctereutes procyonoides]|uniref:(raccoon dog) hypothetical protein n=1 Tax=Nyctereutes procyonoides TaxID=34880 RepID=A0A811YPJ7_NYCPR|nr:unnamed protein product [Nyctereutes procyonoides]